MVDWIDGVCMYIHSLVIFCIRVERVVLCLEVYSHLLGTTTEVCCDFSARCVLQIGPIVDYLTSAHDKITYTFSR
jgi:hypothetical protein